MGRTEEERAAARERRRAYYESLSPEEQKEYREKVRRARKIRKLRKMAIQGGAILLLVIIAVIGVLAQKGCGTTSGKKDDGTKQEVDNTPGEAASEGTIEAPEWVIEDFIRKHKDTRPGTAMEQVGGIVLHATGKPGQSAEATRKEIDSVDKGEDSDPVSHFIIGIDGTIIQCIPLSEISYAAGEARIDGISIECCHIDGSGKFSNATYEALVRLVKWLLETYKLEPETVLRHVDTTGDVCPAYYVNNPHDWNQFMVDIGGAPVIPEETHGEESTAGEETSEETSEESTEETT